MAENKIGIIGNKNIIQSFKFFGVEPFAVESKEEGREVIKKISQDNFTVIFVTEDWAEKLEEELIVLKEKTLPSVISLPTHLGATGYGLKELKKTIERAVGSDVLFKNR